MFFTVDRMTKTTKKTHRVPLIFHRFLDQKSIQKRDLQENTKKCLTKKLRAEGLFPKTGFLGPPKFRGAPWGIHFGTLFLKTSKKKFDSFPGKGSWEPSGGQLEPSGPHFTILAPFWLNFGSILARFWLQFGDFLLFLLFTVPSVVPAFFPFNLLFLFG